ncbi:DnaJ-domain-containing protein [Sarocladium strictum]
MADDNQDLLRYAQEYSEKDIDLYDLLGVDALTPKEDIHRAWRKRSLKYHPDKAGDAFDAEKWELFERARDVLSDTNARARYDASAKAKLLRKQEREAMDQERKRFADDLEARENAHKNQQAAKEQDEREAMNKERERLAEAQRMRDEEKKRQESAAQEMEDLAEARRRMKQKKEEKARRKQAKETMKASAAAGKTPGAANGVVIVPGDYMVDLGEVKKHYWELVCDKLRAVQAARNVAKGQPSDEEVQQAEHSVQEARRRIHEAELQFQKQALAS